uniref:Peptidase S1 domain-containing protein n=1 Tax=Aotus nancymaae TaxID=37293 RepID=A0A2K5CYY2_AOTNA
MTVNEILLHADGNSHRMGSDITLLQLHRRAEFSSRILPACLPEPTMASAPSSSCWVSGWGMVTRMAILLPEPFQLQEAEVSIMENGVCASFFQPQHPGQPSSSDYSTHEDVLSAGDLITGKAICRVSGLSLSALCCPGPLPQGLLWTLPPQA